MLQFYNTFGYWGSILGRSYTDFYTFKNMIPNKQKHLSKSGDIMKAHITFGFFAIYKRDNLSYLLQEI